MVGDVVVFVVVLGAVVVVVVVVVVATVVTVTVVVVFDVVLCDVVAVWADIWDVVVGSDPQAATNSTKITAVTDDLQRALIATPPCRLSLRTATSARAIRPLLSAAVVADNHGMGPVQTRSHPAPLHGLRGSKPATP